MERPAGLKPFAAAGPASEKSGAPASNSAHAKKTAPWQPAPAKPAVRETAPKMAALKVSAPESAAPQAGLPAELGAIAKEVAVCAACPLHKTRTQTVFGTGNPRAKLVFVGEAPGADEDAQGKPFVGRAGQLLTKMIEAMGYGRDEVFIANVLKCRPPGNRDPLPEEVASCEGFLKRQIAAIQPAVICALGTHAARTLLKSDATIGALRGRFHRYEGVPLLATYHPAYLLRSPQNKKEAWNDLQKVRDELKRMSGADGDA